MHSRSRGRRTVLSKAATGRLVSAAKDMADTAVPQMPLELDGRWQVCVDSSGLSASCAVHVADNDTEKDALVKNELHKPMRRLEATRIKKKVYHALTVQELMELLQKEIQDVPIVARTKCK